jgi:EpsI family protein
VSAARWRWAPAVVLGAGALLTTLGVRTQRALTLRAPLETTVPGTIAEYAGADLTLSPEEVRVAGMNDYLMRVFRSPGDTSGYAFSLYVGYYARQTQGRAIHSPKNCLPGSGWEALASTTQRVETEAGPVTVNRYLLQNGPERALVFYWYQGRGRVAANEYVVKWDLLRDAALRRRSEEALVRVMVPIDGDEGAAVSLAERVTSLVVPSLHRALPS